MLARPVRPWSSTRPPIRRGPPTKSRHCRKVPLSSGCLATTPCCVIKRGRAAEIRAGRPCNCNSGCLRRSGLLCSEELQGLPVTSGRIHLQRRMRPLASMAGLRPLGWRKLKPAWRAPSGFAAIPTSALDPAHRPASPAVPALSGPGPHHRQQADRRTTRPCCFPPPWRQLAARGL